MGLEVAAGAMVAGTLYGAYNQYQAGQQTKEIAYQNAALREESARTLMEATGVSIDRKKEEISALLGFQHAQDLGKSGFKGEGTPTWVAEESAKQGAEDIATMYKNAFTQAQQLRAQGRIDIMGGESAARAGEYGGVATLLGGLSQTYMAYNYPSTLGNRVTIR